MRYIILFHNYFYIIIFNIYFRCLQIQLTFYDYDLIKKYSHKSYKIMRSDKNEIFKSFLKPLYRRAQIDHYLEVKPSKKDALEIIDKYR